MLVESILERDFHGLVRIFGLKSAGKTAAIGHLKAVFEGRPGIEFLDEPDCNDPRLTTLERVGENAAQQRAAVVVMTVGSGARFKSPFVTDVELAGWTDDDAI